ncbi:hypothetical protein IMCC12053_2787 [Celeribacter marinus]|uniref:Uncharacterized protein n=2 Tax=Celeribacter marinus TaxID=1397108 RepID=A0A0P0AEJ8_9RHOB|nr:hypothetical protein IMCC12053_2787 [Celeribacter marinus]
MMTSPIVAPHIINLEMALETRLREPDINTMDDAPNLKARKAWRSCGEYDQPALVWHDTPLFIVAWTKAR